MPNLPLENLGRIGYITDRKPFELEPEAWSNVRNVKFNSEGAQKMQGHATALGTPLHAPYWLFPWQSSTGFTWLYSGLTRIGRISGVSHSDVTRFTAVLGDDDYAAAADTVWSGTLLGDLPVLTYEGAVDPPQAWNSVNARFEDLPNFQASTFADLIFTVSDHLVAMKVTKAADYNPRMVKWSQAADPGTYPSSWDETDPATGAGEITLKATEGEIVTAADLNNSTLIYKEDSVIAMRFVGGQSVFAFNTLFAQFGAISPYAVGVLENSHVVVTETDVLLHNGNTFDSIIDDKNRKLLFNSLNRSQVKRVKVTVDRANSLVWIKWVSIAGAGKMDQALLWDYTDNTWSHRDLQEFDYLEYGEVDQATTSRIYDTFTSQVYDGYEELYNAQVTIPGIVIADANNTLIYQADKTNEFNGSPMPILLERTGLPIVGRDRQGRWRIDLDTRKFIRRVHLKMAASGPVNVFVGGQELPDGPVSWVGPITFDPNIQRYIDCRINTLFFAFRLESAAAIGWTLYGYTIELELLGEAPR